MSVSSTLSQFLQHILREMSLRASHKFPSVSDFSQKKSSLLGKGFNIQLFNLWLKFWKKILRLFTSHFSTQLYIFFVQQTKLMWFHLLFYVSTSSSSAYKIVATYVSEYFPVNILCSFTAIDDKTSMSHGSTLLFCAIVLFPGLAENEITGLESSGLIHRWMWRTNYSS